MVQFGPLPVLDYRLFFARNTISYLCKKSIVYLKPMAQWDITEDLIMKKSVLLLASLVFLVAFSSCKQEEKEGQYTPEKKISRIYRDYGEGKTLREVWHWNENILQSIDHYSSGRISWVEEFTYNDDNQIVRVDDFLNGEYIEYEYNGSMISKAVYYDEGSIEMEFAFKYTDNKITELEYIGYDYKKRSSSHLMKEGNNPLKMLLTEETYQVFDKFVNNSVNRGTYGVTIKLTWKENNVSKMELRAGDYEIIVDMKHDTKSNPFRNYYNLYGPTEFAGVEMEIDNMMHSTFSANNITEERWVENDEGDKYTWVVKHSYSYNDMYPTVQRSFGQYGGGDTDSEVYYYEYE
ncbi:MAG: hypothetical protein IIX06_02565 [Bacteroidales bacterium]|nr:hypothetical protein [Bacteroidales bacterium]